MDFRQRLEQNRPAGKDLCPDLQDNMTSDYFATDDIGSLPACLDLRLPNGMRKALPYSFLTELNFDVEKGIEIFANSKKITIMGRNLSKLFDYLVAYRVRYIRANIGNGQSEDGLFVKEILIEQLDS